MRKAKAVKGKQAVKEKDLDLDSDAWPKFEALVKASAKVGHKPHKVASKKAKQKQGGR